MPGHLDAAAYGPLVMTACALIIAAIWLCAAGTFKHIPNLSQAPANQNELTAMRVLNQILSTLKNKNYIILLIGYFFFMIASGIYDTLSVFINTYFWGTATRANTLAGANRCARHDGWRVELTCTHASI